MTPDERERMYQKEYLRQKLAKDMAVEIKHRKYLEEIEKESKEPLKMPVKLTGLAVAFLKEG